MDGGLCSFSRAGGYLLSFLNVSPLLDSLRSRECFLMLQRLVRSPDGTRTGDRLTNQFGDRE